MNIKKLLDEIHAVPGVSGREEEAAKWIASQFEPWCDEVKIHPTNSVIGIKRAIKRTPDAVVRKMMFAAHLDQVGLVVSKIEPGGFLRFTGIGMDHKVLAGQPVHLLGRKTIKGIISIRSFSTLPASENEKNQQMDELYIDTGLPEEELKKWVRVGDLVRLHSEPLLLENSFYTSPTLDDRICVASMILGMKNLKPIQHDWDIYFVATCGEETTGKGARATAWDIQPDFAIAMDVTFGGQPGVSEPFGAEVGSGLAISKGPVYDSFYGNQIMEISKRHKIVLKESPDMSGFGTDAASIRMTGGGIPVTLVSLPIKSMHTPVEFASLDDTEELGRLIPLIASELKFKGNKEVNGE